MSSPLKSTATRSHRPRAVTVFAAAFVAGAAAAVGVNRTLDVRLEQLKPRVESEPIFVALRSLPQGSPVTVWDVGLRDWPKAMLPATAVRAEDSFQGMVLKHPLREGQPLLSIQLTPAVRDPQSPPESTSPGRPPAFTQAAPRFEGDLWTPAEPPGSPPVTAAGTAKTTPFDPPSASGVTAVPATLVKSPDLPPSPPRPAPAVDSGEAAAIEPAATVLPPADRNQESSTASGGGSPGDEGGTPASPAFPGPPAETAAAAEGDAPTPTVADGSAVPAPPAPVAAASVMAAASDGDGIPAPVVGPSTPRSSFPRYLVVPENIAIQADASFTQRPVAVVGPPLVSAKQPTQATSPGGNSGRPQAPTGERERAAGSTEPNMPQARQPQRHGRQAPVIRGGQAPAEPRSRVGAIPPSKRPGVPAASPVSRPEAAAPVTAR